MKRGNVLLVLCCLAALLLMASVVYAAAITPQTIDTDGLILTPVAISTSTMSNEFANDGNEFIWIDNGSGGTLYYTVTVPGMVGGFSLSDVTGSVGDGLDVYLGPFNPTYCNASDGNVDFEVSSSTSVNVAVLELD